MFINPFFYSAVLIKVNSNLLANKFCECVSFDFLLRAAESSYYYRKQASKQALIFGLRSLSSSILHSFFYINKCQANNGIIRKQTLCVLVTLLPHRRRRCRSVPSGAKYYTLDSGCILIASWIYLILWIIWWD